MIESRVTRCQLCDAPVEWKTTPSGLRIPIDPTPHATGPLYIDEKTGHVRVLHTEDRAVFKGTRYSSHHATCPARQAEKDRALEGRRDRKKNDPDDG